MCVCVCVCVCVCLYIAKYYYSYYINQNNVLNSFPSLQISFFGVLCDMTTTVTKQSLTCSRHVTKPLSSGGR